MSNHTAPKSGLESRKHRRPRLSVTFASPPNIRRRKEEEPHMVVDREDDPNCVDSDSGSSLFYWDDETTLLDELMGKPLKKNGDAMLALADSLRDAFVERGKVTKLEMARVLVSVHSDVKRAVRLLTDQDGSYGKCVVQFAKGCKRSEAVYMHIGKILEKYIANQVQIERLRAQIKADLAEREAIWTNLERSMKEILKPLRERIQDAPARIERKITQLEEQAKISEKKRQSSLQKDLKSYLKNL